MQGLQRDRFYFNVNREVSYWQDPRVVCPTSLLQLTFLLHLMWGCPCVCYPTPRMRCNSISPRQCQAPAQLWLGLKLNGCLQTPSKSSPMLLAQMVIMVPLLIFGVAGAAFYWYLAKFHPKQLANFGKRTKRSGKRPWHSPRAVPGL